MKVRHATPAVIAAILAALPMPAVADTAAVQEQIRSLQLSPAMLFPTRVPARLQKADTTLNVENGVVVTWDRGTINDQMRVGYLTLSRMATSQLRQDLRTVRLRGYRPRQVTIGSRRVWRLCGHVCGYEWVEAGRAYGVFGIYYVGDEDGRTIDRDQRTVIRSLAPLVG